MRVNSNRTKNQNRRASNPKLSMNNSRAEYFVCCLNSISASIIFIPGSSTVSASLCLSRACKNKLCNGCFPDIINQAATSPRILYTTIYFRTTGIIDMKHANQLEPVPHTSTSRRGLTSSLPARKAGYARSPAGVARYFGDPVLFADHGDVLRR